jgi:Short C-terminal domain
MVGRPGCAAGERFGPHAANLARGDSVAQAPRGESMSELDRIDALMKLGELHDAGVLTDAQFETVREKLI